MSCKITIVRFLLYTHKQATFLRLRVPFPLSLLFAHPFLVRPTPMHRWEHLQQINTYCIPQIHTNCWKPTGEHMQKWDCVIPNKVMRLESVFFWHNPNKEARSKVSLWCCEHQDVWLCCSRVVLRQKSRGGERRAEEMKIPSNSG